MSWLLRKYRLVRLKCREYVLQAEAEHAQGLMDDHRRRYLNTLRDLRAVRRQIVTIEEPEVLLKHVA